MLKLLSVVTLIGLALAGLPGSSGDETDCITCDWLPEEPTKVLFLINRYVEMAADDLSNLSTGKLLASALEGLEQAEKDGFLPAELSELGEVEDQKLLKEMLTDMISITRWSECDADVIGNMTTIEARLEEGRDPTEGLRSIDDIEETKYKTKRLTRFFEEQHLRLFEICKESAKVAIDGIKEDPDVQATRRTFITLGELLERKLKEQKKKPSFTSIFMVGLQPFSDNLELESSYKSLRAYDMAVLKLGKIIVERDIYFEKIANTFEDFFLGGGDKAQTTGGQRSGGDSCQLMKEKIAKHKQVEERLSKILRPLLYLRNYYPAYYATIPRSEMRGRAIFQVESSFTKDYLAKNEEVADMIELLGFIKKATKRVGSHFCKRNSQ